MLRRFIRNKRGNVTMITAFTLPVLVLGIGGAVDYAHVLRSKARMQAAVDSALLATMAHRQKVENADSSQLLTYFKQHLAAVRSKQLNEAVTFKDYKLQLDEKDNRVRVQVTADVKTTFLKLAGINAFQIPLQAEARASMNYTEVALVLDVTGSMRGSKIAELKDAAKKFLDTIYTRITSQGSADNFHVAIVPFTRYVNVGTQYANASWIDVVPERQLTKTVCLWRWCWTVERTVKWEGCVGSRDYPYNLRDDSYGLFKVPGVMDYLRDKRYPIDHYDGYTWYETDCPPPLTPLQSLRYNKNLLMQRIDQLTAGGWTYIPAGLMWGWRVLSSEVPFTQGASNDEVVKKNVRKVIVLMTDGANSRAPSQRSEIYPYSEHASSYAEYADRLTREACSNITAINPATGRRNADIITITFDVSNGEIKQLMEDCSTLGAHDASSGELVKQFENIANKLVELHLSK